MSESEDEPFGCVDCGWSGHNAEHVSWDDRVLHHGERQNHYGGGSPHPATFMGHITSVPMGPTTVAPSVAAEPSLQAEENTRERSRKQRVCLLLVSLGFS